MEYFWQDTSEGKWWKEKENFHNFKIVYTWLAGLKPHKRCIVWLIRSHPRPRFAEEHICLQSNLGHQPASFSDSQRQCQSGTDVTASPRCRDCRDCRCKASSKILKKEKTGHKRQTNKHKASCGLLYLVKSSFYLYSVCTIFLLYFYCISSVFVLYLYERGHGLGRELAALYLLPISLMSQNWTLTDSWCWINSPDSLLMMVMRIRLNIFQHQLSFTF